MNNSLKVKPEDLKAGARYFIESKETQNENFDIMIATLHDVNDTVFSIANGARAESIFCKHCFNFYSVPKDFELKWNMVFAQDSFRRPKALMGFTSMLKAVVLNLIDGEPVGSMRWDEYIPIPDEETEIIEIKGKKYNLSSVVERIKELPEVE